MLHGKKPDELHRRAIDVSLILYAEHEFNASTFTARVDHVDDVRFLFGDYGGMGALGTATRRGERGARLELMRNFRLPIRPEGSC